MVSLVDLWLPIVLSAVGVFIVSSLVHMVLGWHKADYSHLAAEDEFRAHVRSQGVGRGQYVFPWCGSMKDMGSPEMIKKYEEGPLGYMVLLPTGVPAIGKQLLQWFLFCLVIAAVCGYVASVAFGRGAAGEDVFRLVATVGLTGWGLGVVNDSIWKGISWATTGRFLVDGLLYALTTGAIFAALWPAAVPTP